MRSGGTGDRPPPLLPAIQLPLDAVPSIAGYNLCYLVPGAEPALMRAAQQGQVHKNAASRKVSRLSHQIAKLGK